MSSYKQLLWTKQKQKKKTKVTVMTILNFMSKEKNFSLGGLCDGFSEQNQNSTIYRATQTWTPSSKMKNKYLRNVSQERMQSCEIQTCGSKS